MAANVFSMEAVTWLSSAMVDQGKYDIRIEAAMAKMYCSETAWKIIDDALQIRGGRGYEKAESLKGRGEKPIPIERMMRDSRINRIIEGTTDIMHLFLAREALDPHMEVAGELLLKHIPLGQKVRAGIKMANFYLKWYPNQWINTSAFSSYTEFHPKLARHMKYVERTSHQLARSIFHAMGMYQNTLERRQIMLSRFVDIGTELFVISATCSYANNMANKDSDAMEPIHLANYFCKQSRRRIEQYFSDVSDNDDSQANKISKDFLNGKYKWMEEGIIKCIED